MSTGNNVPSLWAVSFFTSLEPVRSTSPSSPIPLRLKCPAHVSSSFCDNPMTGGGDMSRGRHHHLWFGRSAMLISIGPGLDT
eukprot:CAMPEP_0174329904 /NCGR_PEP_ID=MMETSP0810-20121108/16235_1 /TAXON_ID=73025 ORGANISM="Eutreptiella gymnastica-like, Strain CCMP1594" /NCGR_SAMPLE_ID=MMETSP0810 /ASSEMBLY_ACC=CAM_ASM_000659 /LENGTH=81 /DNA_ID=CAMNT_0015444721 /DNA_START=761 /DNA_END=1003 /DNA_ORIENTATION=-